MYNRYSPFTHLSQMSVDISSLSISGTGFDEIAMDQYHQILKVAIASYRVEPRFRKRVLPRHVSNDENSDSHFKKPKVIKVSSRTISDLRKYLNPLKKGKPVKLISTSLSTQVFNALLTYLTKLDKSKQLETIEKPENFLRQFMLIATRELKTLKGQMFMDSLDTQTTIFLSIMQEVVKNDKEGDSIMKKLQEARFTLSSSSNNVNDFEYIMPSFKLSEMSLAQHVGAIFQIDDKELQNDILSLKNNITPDKIIHDQKTYLVNCLKQQHLVYQKRDFLDSSSFTNWLKVESLNTENYISQIDSKPVNLCEPSAFFNLVPRSSALYYQTLLEKCMRYDSRMNASSNTPLLSTSSRELIEECVKIWRIDAFTAMIYFFKTSCSTVLSTSDGSINSDLFFLVLNLMKKYLTDLKLSIDKSTWPSKTRLEWIDCLEICYLKTMKGIQTCISQVLTSKPPFSQYLNVLAEIEQDSLFRNIVAKHVPDKLEKQLIHKLNDTILLRYKDLLTEIPTDNTIDLIHIADLSRKIVEDTKMLQKRYKHPLLGKIPIAPTYAKRIITDFAVDAKYMLKSIKQNSADISFADALDIYKTLSEIRDIFTQVTDTPFKFDLEKGFYKYLKNWAINASEQIVAVTNTAVAQDDLGCASPENDILYSTSVKDIFMMINQNVSFLKDLNWKNEYHLAKVSTLLFQYISMALITYCDKMYDTIVADLDEEDQKNVATTLPGETNSYDSLLSGTSAWIADMKAAVTRSQKLTPPEPYAFKNRTCVALNNIVQCLQNLDELEDILDPEYVSNVMNRENPSIFKEYTNHFFTIKVVQAEGIKSPVGKDAPDANVWLSNNNTKKVFARTRTIPSSDRPEWDEEFEVVLFPGASVSILATLWDKSFKRFSSDAVIGRTLFHLSPKEFNNNGIPRDLILNLDTEGTLVLQVSLESEREDALFCMGKTRRSLIHARDRVIKLMVGKFSPFIQFAFSRDVLKNACGSNGLLLISEEQRIDVILPLFDYLNSNLDILARILPESLLQKVILQMWNVVLASAEHLILPLLSTVKMAKNSNKLWSNINFNSGMNIAGFGRPLTPLEVKTVFEWLHVLCYEQFYNEGEGASLEKLQNYQYKLLLKVSEHYEKPVGEILSKVRECEPMTIEHIRERNYFYITVDSKEKKLTRAATIARQKTIGAQGSKKQMHKAAEDVKIAQETDSNANAAAFEDMLLRILLTKGEMGFVAERLEQREKFTQSVSAESFARAAAAGAFNGIR
ncbi:hypothetical protein PP7435_CHR1-0392 [Komagataella phaffii CBS 7435]|uniref:Uncharacterized protein n=2 Tax=Komagataella phaffii TaxID=460519 RepID=C4QW27_KOMPG|nr:uncharacterized protein PAS_chr1-1_0090 [Komagataella phaffii GS115]CAH2446116.1 hypothetical protein BQ9382_C1-2055 [Komagataella phaffii CBS 7435]CAY67450.1 Putative protein of unknown function [Komagataella phaffii GS115]CCA36549.1 hypothetical protein PP7435_CHR1-0392 [Komagataella phaffii CBS 7435]